MRRRCHCCRCRRVRAFFTQRQGFLDLIGIQNSSRGRGTIAEQSRILFVVFIAARSVGFLQLPRPRPPFFYS